MIPGPSLQAALADAKENRQAALYQVLPKLQVQEENKYYFKLLNLGMVYLCSNRRWNNYFLYYCYLDVLLLAAKRIPI